LEAALRAGVTAGPAEVGTDVNGKTYASYDHRVTGRHMNADLRRLGF